jgi:hypothetical protein
MVSANFEKHFIELKTPENMTEVQDNLAALASFANKLGVQGLQSKQASFKTLSTQMLEVCLHCQRTIISPG